MNTNFSNACGCYYDQHTAANKFFPCELHSREACDELRAELAQAKLDIADLRSELARAVTAAREAIFFKKKKP